VKVNAKSILGVMMLAAGMGSQLILAVDGDDEEDAIKAVSELLESTFD
jgi:phosphotransferase system HPr (HPr) family protein